MREAESNPLLRCDDCSIYIRNRDTLWQKILVWMCAFFLAIVPFVRNFMPGRVWLAFDEPGAWGCFGLVAYVFAVSACVSVGFSWSTIHIDLTSKRVVKEHRWGLFRGRRTDSLASFNEVILVVDSENGTSVELAGTSIPAFVLVWGRRHADTVRMAKEIASRLMLPLKSHER